MLILPKLACGLAAREWSRYLRDSKPNRVSPLPGGLHWTDIRPTAFQLPLGTTLGRLRETARGAQRGLLDVRLQPGTSGFAAG